MLPEQNRKNADWDQKERRPAATAGQSCPPSPMMKGIERRHGLGVAGGEQHRERVFVPGKDQQKIAVAAMPVVACGSTTLKKRAGANKPSIMAALFVFARDLVDEAFRSHTASETFTAV